MSKEQNKIRLTIDLTQELYDKFVSSNFRRESNTDAEAIRSIIKYAIGEDTTSKVSSQDNN